MAGKLNPLLDRLCAAFPAVFSRKAPQPLKIGLGEGEGMGFPPVSARAGGQGQ